jgi:drug/metabolite transporter (DMT)-like permease
VHREKSGFLLAAGAAVLFGANQPASQVLITGPLGAPNMVTARLLALAVLFLAIALVRHRGSFRLGRREAGMLIVFGLVGLAGEQWAVTEAIARLDVSIVILCVYSGPFLIALWCRLVRKEPMPTAVWIAIATGLFGLALAVGLIGGEIGVLSLSGLALALLAGCIFAYYALHATTLLAARPAPIVLGLAAVVALVAWTAFAAPPRDFPVDELAGSVHLAGMTMPAWSLLIVSVVLGTAVPYQMTLAGISLIGPTPTTVVGMIEPVLAVLLAWAWLGQSLTLLRCLGGIAVLVAVVVVQRARRGTTVVAV